MKNKQRLFLLLLSLMLFSLVAISVSGQEFPNGWSFTNSDDAAFFMGLGLTMCLLIFVVPLILAILICIWLYKDAERRGKQGILWVLILILASVFFNFIGLIAVIVIWLLTRPPEGGNKPAGAGMQQQSTERRCPGCGRVIPDDARVCPYCGKNFDQTK